MQRGDKLAVRFEVTDGNRAIAVSYQGILPDLFREGQGVIAEGTLEPGGGFKADFGARQARREIHAEGSRRRAEEAGPLERRHREEEMIAEIGHYALVLALGLALIQSVVPMVGARLRDDTLMGVAGPTALAQFALRGDCRSPR